MFHQPELADAIAALNAVVYPHRDLVLVHYFRSPAVGFTDDLLLKISRTPGRSYYDKANRVAAQGQYRLDDLWFDLTESEKERLDTGLDTLRRARELVGVAPPYAVVREVIDSLGMRLVARASWRGEQAVANLDKLLDVARSAEFLSYEDFLEYIESEEQNERGTGEAAELISADAVKIMTIHAAKGLEFPVVYLPDLNSGVSGRSSTVDADGANWMTLRLPTDMRGDANVFLSDYFKNRMEQQALAEERRVFYVAMTRCRQHLVLCASDGKSAGKNSFFDMIKPEFEAAAAAGELLTPDDFSDAELFPPDPDSFQHPALKSSREARLEAALRAATLLIEKADLR
jgi:ATP-dependent helicase/nuclease subunit A